MDQIRFIIIRYQTRKAIFVFKTLMANLNIKIMAGKSHIRREIGLVIELGKKNLIMENVCIIPYTINEHFTICIYYIMHHIGTSNCAKQFLKTHTYSRFRWKRFFFCILCLNLLVYE